MLRDHHAVPAQPRLPFSPAGVEPRPARRRPRTGRFDVAPCTEALDRRTLLAAALSVLDPTFGSGGTTSVNLTHGIFVAAAVAAQPDGKIVVAGQSAGGIGAARFNADGTPDTGFGPAGTGIVITDATSREDQASAVGIAPDGGIVAAGTNTDPAGPLSGSNGDIVLVKYSTNGSLDPAFGDGGVVVTDVAGRDDLPVRLVVQPDGKIVLAALDRQGLQGVVRSAARVVMMRYGAGGTLDASFGSGGMTITDLPSDYEQPTAAVLGPDGTLVVAAHGSNSLAPDQAFVLRYTSAGTLDPTFGSGGVVEMPGRTALSDLAVTGDGNVIACGSTTVTGRDGTSSDFVLFRLESNGTPDSAFGRNGIVVTNFGTDGSSRADDRASALVLAGGGLVVAGSTNADVTGSAPGVRRVAIARYTEAGVLERKYGQRGKAIEAVGPDDSFATDLVATPDAKLLMFGGNGQGAFIARFYPQPIPRFARLSRGTLRVTGTRGADQLVITPALDGSLQATLNGFSQRFAAGDVRRIVLSGGRGDDLLTVDSAITLPAALLGGAGNDRLSGGGGPDRIIGGPGNDALFSRDSIADVLLGGAGDDQARKDEMDRARGVETLLP